MEPSKVLHFWFKELKPEDHFKKSDELDAEIRSRFLSLYESIIADDISWKESSESFLAKVIVLDQFSRNMFRGTGQSFASDRIALCAAKSSINQDWDLKIDAPARQFFYMPLMHSENLSDQERCVRLMKSRLTQDPSNLIHAQVHRQVIRQFGRFPYRNQALDRKDTQPETAYLAAGGYGLTYEQMTAALSV